MRRMDWERLICMIVVAVAAFVMGNTVGKYNMVVEIAKMAIKECDTKTKLAEKQLKDLEARHLFEAMTDTEKTGNEPDKSDNSDKH